MLVGRSIILDFCGKLFMIRTHRGPYRTNCKIKTMKSPRYLVPDGTYMADPAAHVFNGRLYIYPSHDIESGIP